MKKFDDLLKLINKHKRLLLFFAILLVIFHKFIVMIITLIIFLILGMVSMKLSRVMPHISLETVTPTSILVGYIWGWQIALAYGLIAGTIGYTNASQMNITTIICTGLMGLVGVLGSLFKSLAFPFWVAYLLAYTIRAFLSYFLISKVNSNVIENITHSFIESIYNMVVVINFMTIFHVIILKLL